MPIQRFYVPTSSPYKLYTEQFTSSTTWTAPVGVTNVKYTIVGAGGGGGSASRTASQLDPVVVTHYAGGGGAGGRVEEGYLNVNPGVVYDIQIGAGGSGSIGDTTLGVPGISSVTSAGEGGYSSFNFSYTNSKNLIPNGAGELDTNTWLAYNTNAALGVIQTNLSTGYTTVRNPAGVGNIFNNTISPIEGVTESSGYTKYLLNTTSTTSADLVTIVKINPNTQYTLNAYSYISSGSTSTTNISMSWLANAAEVNFISTQSGTQHSQSGTSLFSNTVTATSPSNANFVAIRLHKWGPTGTRVSWTGVQLEQSSSPTEYFGLFSPGNHVDSPFGLIQINSGIYAPGGGGGQSIYESSLVNGVGPGGGRAVASGGSCLAGNGSGSNGFTNNIFPFTAGGSPGLNSINNGRYSVTSGNPAITGAGFVGPPQNPGVFQGYGAAGMGGNTGVLASRLRNPSRVTKDYGVGGDGLGFATGGAPIFYNGYNGNSGFLAIEYFGPAA